MRAEMAALLQKLEGRLDAIDGKLNSLVRQQKNFSQALSADSLMSRLLTGEFEERIEALERKVKELEPHK
jgi:polyhydroxyalkanoate synthesis regulator phasin